MGKLNFEISTKEKMKFMSNQSISTIFIFPKFHFTFSHQRSFLIEFLSIFLLSSVDIVLLLGWNVIQNAGRKVCLGEGTRDMKMFGYSPCRNSLFQCSGVSGNDQN